MKDIYYIFGTLFFIAQKWQNIIDRKLGERTGLTTRQWMLLVILTRTFSDKLPTISEAAAAFGTSRQNLKRIATDLQKKDYIIITPDPNDQRIQRLVLTGKHTGMFEGEENEAWQEEIVKDLFAGMDPEEQARLSKSMYKLYKRIGQIENEQ